VETLAVSLEKTTLGGYRSGRRVNLERSLTPETRMGGHIVKGHVDGVGTVATVREDGKNVYFSVAVPPDMGRYCISEGSIAIDGTSLTIADITDGGPAGTTITVNVIPATWRTTVLSDRTTGEMVNLEVDVLARYVERLLTATPQRTGVGSNALTLIRVPGAWEIPIAAKRAASSRASDGVICLGAVIRGGTPHFDYVAADVSKGVAAIGMETGVPVTFGVLTTDTIEQAVERAGTKAGNKGWEAAEATLGMVDLFQAMEK
jgi:6,7-dimethyl-8-ribityllumazine synthase